MNERLLQVRKRITLGSLIAITWLIKLFSRIVPYRIGVQAGGVLGFITYYLLSKERKKTIAHLTQAYNERSHAWIRRTARRCFVHLGKSLLEVVLITPSRLLNTVDVHGEENLHSALSRGKGVVWVTGHIGNWELMAYKIAQKYPVSVIAAPIKPVQVNDMIIGLRAAMGVKTIVRTRPGATKELIRSFRENRILGILIDQDTDVESAFVDFMGKPAWTPTAAASMAIKFGAAVLFGHIKRGPDDRHTVMIEGPLHLINTGDTEKDIIANTAMLSKKIEDYINKDPEQWVWMHRRWRRQP
ncbi:MAG TPA: lysophospholipid acyltransferase family protein [Nitrospirota bacterium]|nr:lysophospholipid acyltransferase family protein [Nitrospirota bacterium]